MFSRKFSNTIRKKKRLLISLLTLLVLTLGLGYSAFLSDFSFLGSLDVAGYMEPTLYNVLRKEAVTGGLARKYTGEHGDSMDSTKSTEDIYQWIASNNIEYKEIMEKNNVIFADKCWQMIRTTDTGGVKMLYNGEAEDNKCLDTRAKHVGYNNNSIETINDDYWYGTDYTYDETNNVFQISGDTEQTTWNEENVASLIGKYTCKGISEDDTCETLYLIKSYSSSTYANVLKIDANSNYSVYGSLPFDSGSDSMSSIGYMHGDIYTTDGLNYIYKTIPKQSYQYSEIARNIEPYYYYSKTITFDGTNYTLDNPILGSNVPNGDYSSYYSFLGNSTTGPNLYFLTGKSNNVNQYNCIKISPTVTFNSYTILLSNRITDNGDDTYTLDQANTITVDAVDWYNNYTNYKNYYSCGDATTTTCENPIYIIETKPNSYYYYSGRKIVLGKSRNGTTLLDTIRISQSYLFTNSDDYLDYKYTCDTDSNICTEENLLLIDSYKDNGWVLVKNRYYGSSLSWDGTNYTLVDTVGIETYDNTNDLSNHHYTCIDGSQKSCPVIAYLHSTDRNVDNYYYHYIKLKDGITSINQVLDNMLKKNEHDSTIKFGVDAWYKKYLLSYDDYIEDTIYCNNRIISDNGGTWDENSRLGATIYFGSLRGSDGLITYNTDLSCTNITDKFSTSNNYAKLTYKTGLMTAYEMMTLYWKGKNTGVTYWLGTPNFYLGTGYNVIVGPGGNYTSSSYQSMEYSINYSNLGRSFGVKPAISLKSNIKFTDGNGSKESPYYIGESYTITNNNSLFKIRKKAAPGYTVEITNPDYVVTSFKVNGTLVEGDSFIMPEEDVEITDITYTDAYYSIINSDESINLPITARYKDTIKLTGDGIFIKSFKMNGELVNGDTFTMPLQDVVITDIVKSYGVESAHNAYESNLDNYVYYENTFEGAIGLNVTLTYQLYNYYNDWVALYDNSGKQQPIGNIKYSSTILTTKNIIVNGDYLKIIFNTDSSVDDYYGFKAEIIPIYEGYNITSQDTDIVVQTKGVEGAKIPIKQPGYVINSFKLNGELIEGNAFIMPDEDVVISDVVKVYGTESEHNNYEKNINNEIYYENTFEGAIGLNVTLTYQLQGFDYVYLYYHAPDFPEEYKRYNGYTLKTENIVLNGNYLRVSFKSNDYTGSYSYYGFKVEVTPIYEGYNISCSDEHFKVQSKAIPGATIPIKLEENGYFLDSYKVNGNLINEQSFIMPDEDVTITDIEKIAGTESEHNPYPSNLNNVVYYENTFEGAIGLNITLTYRTESTYDWIYLYDSSNGKPIGNKKYGSSTLTTENITINGNYLKVTFNTNNSNNNYYGFKVIITPIYEGYNITCTDNDISIQSKAIAGLSIPINHDGYIIKSFRLNGTLIENADTFEMPNEDVSITDVVKVHGVESEHNPYSAHQNNVVYYENTFEDAFALNVNITYQTDAYGEDKIMLYDSNNGPPIGNKIYKNSTLTTETITVYSDYLKVVFNTDGSNNNYYGLKVEITPIYEQGYYITSSNSNIRVQTRAYAGDTVPIYHEGYLLESFKLNGTLVNGDSFIMPEENVEITDVVGGYGAESEHTPYPNSQSNVVYYENSFEGAIGLNVSLTYQTQGTSYDWIYLYDSNNGNPINNKKYGGTTLTTENIVINGNYLKVIFNTNSSNNNYYGFRAEVTPIYEGYEITCSDENINVQSQAIPGAIVPVKLERVGYIIKSYKVNGTLIETDKFEMPNEDVEITDIVKVYGAESEHNPYPNSQNNEIYYENTFEGATGLKISLKYQTEGTSYDWIYLYDSSEGNPINNNKYGGTSLRTENIIINSNYLKILFRTDGVTNNYYGFRAEVTPIYEGYNITCNDNDVNVISKAISGSKVQLTLNQSNQIIKSFKLNGTLVENNSFTMPNEDVVITDVVKVYGAESAHNGYLNDQNNVVYFDKTFEGAVGLNISLTYQTEGTSYDWLYLYDSSEGNPINNKKYGGTTLKTDNIIINGNYLKAIFKTNNSTNNYYGFKIEVTPIYEGYNITCNDNDVNVISKAISGSKVKLKSKQTNYIIKSFKLNGTTVEDNTFTMPSENVSITDVEKVYGTESDHNGYLNNQNNVVYFEKSFEGAIGLNVSIKYQTQGTSYDWVYLYDSNNGKPIDNKKYGGTTLTTDNLVVNSNYLKVVFKTDSSGNEYYGFRMEVTPIYEGYNITCQEEYVNVQSKAASGAKISLVSQTEGYMITSFKLNGTLVTGDSFIMPSEDVTITDVEKKEGVESEHNPYANNINSVVYYEKIFENATSLTVELTYQTEGTGCDWIYLYDSSGGSPIDNKKYGGSTLTTETITINSNYLKIVFRTDGSVNDYYGFKAIITPNYE